ncbi:unnamed protein product [Blepharisma stoltei]|uniref:NAD-dependent epimerase/dehydratase domain-containing protein n=1 Tax=Blepharisma stoltei TaxID=1481888 RepID=A0AAU9IRM1_9CILI|nr:unnamed protein product [Blepharisma stoltei]
MEKSLLVFGGSGFVGSAILKYAVSQGIKCMSISRSGKPRHPEPWQTNVEYIHGDALDQSSYINLIPKASGVIHSIGVLIDSRTPLNISKTYQGSYEHMNRDTALKICELLEGKDKTFVFLSAERGMWFSPRYLQTKRQVEDYLAANRDKIPSVVLRPGFMFDSQDSTKNLLATGINMLNWGDGPLKWAGLNWVSETFVPSKSQHVDSVAKAAVLSALVPEFRGRTLNVSDIDEVAQKYEKFNA